MSLQSLRNPLVCYSMVYLLNLSELTLSTLFCRPEMMETIQRRHIKVGNPFNYIELSTPTAKHKTVSTSQSIIQLCTGHLGVFSCGILKLKPCEQQRLYILLYCFLFICFFYKFYSVTRPIASNYSDAIDRKLIVR